MFQETSSIWTMDKRRGQIAQQLTYCQAQWAHTGEFQEVSSWGRWINVGVEFHSSSLPVTEQGARIVKAPGSFFHWTIQGSSIYSNEATSVSARFLNFPGTFFHGPNGRNFHSRNLPWQCEPLPLQGVSCCGIRPLRLSIAPMDDCNHDY